MSFRKLAELEFQSYQNALRLHSDSLLLYANRSFASAFALSVLANEEFGKGFGIAEICFQVRFEKKFSREDAKFLRDLLTDHRVKQRWFASHIFSWPMMARKYQVKRTERLQVEKNNALYVGVRVGDHKIVRPFLLRKAKARKQLRITNNAFIDMVQGTLDGKY